MATITTESRSYQHFGPALTGVNDIIFSRTINKLLLTTTGTVNISFDNGNRFMAVTAGTYSWDHLNVNHIFFTGGGTYEGCGMAL